MTEAKPKKMIKMSTRENLAGWAFISLNFIGYLAFKLIPLILAGVLSFSKWNMTTSLSTMTFVGFDNFVKMFKDSFFRTSFTNTILYAVVMVPVAIFLSLIFAVILDRYVFGKGLLRLAFYLPNISSMVAVSVIWMILFLPSYGPINMFLQSIGVANPPKWIYGKDTSLMSIMLVGIWQRLGYNIIIILAGLQGISQTLYEAAEIDGANGIQKFWYITIPSLRDTMFFLIMMSFISSFQVFTPVQVMTKGGPGKSSYVLVYYIYSKAFEGNELGYASAMAWALFFLVFIFSMGRMIFQRRKAE